METVRGDGDTTVHGQGGGVMVPLKKPTMQEELILMRQFLRFRLCYRRCRRGVRRSIRKMEQTSNIEKSIIR